MKILTIVGARPQFIKAAAVSKQFSKYSEINEVIIHTGQHYDEKMSEIFFRELNIPLPNYNLKMGGLSHGAMTGRMLEGIEQVCFKEKPDVVLVYGDTNSTLAGALAAKKIGIKVAHVESGLRSYNMGMPEEINRILTDRISDFLFCPTTSAVKNLEAEGLAKENVKIVNSGDVMFDAIVLFSKKAISPSFPLNDSFILCTIHRAENTDNEENLKSLIETLNEISLEHEIIIPIHPRTRKKIKDYNLQISPAVRMVDPVGYFEMLFLLKNAMMVLTDSGGLQKEAFFSQKPCVTLRNETEWIELIETGHNILAGTRKVNILKAYNDLKDVKVTSTGDIFGVGKACEKIAKHLIS